MNINQTYLYFCMCASICNLQHLTASATVFLGIAAGPEGHASRRFHKPYTAIHTLHKSIVLTCTVFHRDVSVFFGFSNYYTVLCKSLKSPLISLFFNFLISFFLSCSFQDFPNVCQGFLWTFAAFSLISSSSLYSLFVKLLNTDL